MNVLLVSECDKRALTETRRILDQFAERRGERTWQTPVTQDGLDALRRLLRKTARKNTAVACHWIRGADHTELLWVVGDRKRFGEQGAIPTNTTQRDVLRQADENNWHAGELMRLLVDMAGLMHDLGKAMNAFQARLNSALSGRNLVRHEWVSLRLLEAFVGEDDDAAWLARLAAPTSTDDARWLGQLQRDGLDGALDSPFKSLHRAPLAQALGWLIVTHHRLPQLPYGSVFQTSSLAGLLTRLEPSWNEPAFVQATPETVQPYWQFPQGLPTQHTAWRQRASRMARRLLAMPGRHETVMANPFVMHLSRLALMLADHHYSSLEGPSAERVAVKDPGQLLANTRSNGQPNQTLTEHLLGVAEHGAEVARFLPQFERHLPRLAKHRRLKQRATHERYRWQDKSAELAATFRSRSQAQGAFIVNMASTGCGKTLANARVMYALADPAQGMRCAFAMGLRTLTLQTGKAFKDMLALGDDELAIRVGGSASRALFEHHETQAEVTGSASRQSLIEEDGHVLYEGQTDQHPLLRRAVADPQVRALLLAPLLVCTIDHLTPATESQRGGRQIAPMLRLMSGDLVLDEPDDFDLTDLPALTRLVHWAGLLGARVLLSSATLPPALVQGLFEAYCNGRQHFNRNCSARPSGAEQAPAVCCAWVDEFHQFAKDCPDAAAFERTHAQFAQRRHAELVRQAATPRRSARLLPLTGLQGLHRRDLPAMAQAFAAQVLAGAWHLHAGHHSVDPVTQRQVSFGLVRMANIEPLYEVALALFRETPPPGVCVHLCVYHSRHPLIVRSAIERQLDRALDRHDPAAVFALPEVRQRLDEAPALAHMFIVLASPVSEVGRDHDYDWAVVEPSSMRSLVQLAGRVRRHRADPASTPNILVFTHNLRHYRAPGHAAFCKPGFETDEPAFQLASHDLQHLLAAEELAAVDARPRIVALPAAALRPHERLVDLEHARLRASMLPGGAAAVAPVRAGGSRARAAAAQASPTPELNASTWWQQAPQDSLLTAVLQQQQPFRKDSGPKDVDLVLLPDEDGEREVLYWVTDGARRGEKLYVVRDHDCTRVADTLVQGDRISPWGVTDYMAELQALATALDRPLANCAQRFGTCSVPDSEQGWRYHPVLGFAKRR